MQVQQTLDDLTGKLLIAMPGMSDPRFDRSVVFLCAHSSEGAMGLIVNKPSADLEIADLLRQIGVTPAETLDPMPVHFGGPVENGRGFVLHGADYTGNESTLKVDASFGMTATVDILQQIAAGTGPAQCIMALGYAGWGPGQLESELQQNGWLTSDASLELVFGSDSSAKWERALRGLGINPLLLSSTGGRA